MIVPVARDQAGLDAIQTYISDTVTALEAMTVEIGKGSSVSFARALVVKTDTDLEKSM